MTSKERAAMQQALGALEVLGYGESYAAIDLREALAEQAEQKPVAWTRKRFGEDREYCEEPFTTDWTPLYAAPVRTKDLTDDEIWEIWFKDITLDWDERCRAAIAADREKNK